MGLARNSRALETRVSVLDISPRFAADMGFIRRTDHIRFNASVAPRFYARGRSWFHSIVPEVFYDRVHRHGSTRHVGRLTDDELGALVNLDLPLSTEIGGGYFRSYTFHEDRPFPGQDRVAIWANSSRFAAVQGGVFSSFGGDVVFDEAVAGRSWRWELSTDVRFTPQLDASFTVAGLRLKRRETGTRFVDAAIPRLRMSYQHNRELAFRAIAELDSERKFDAAGAPTPSETRASLDFLATYLVRPETVVYLGWGSRLEGDGLRAARPERSGAFFKVSYLWQL